MKKIFAFLFSLLTLFSACKKAEEARKSSSSIVIKYEVTWEGTAVTGYDNSISYFNSSGNEEKDRNLSGSSWTKSITVDPGVVKQVVLIPTINTSKPGYSTAVVYVDGKSRSASSSESTVNGAVFKHWTKAIMVYDPSW